jgi:hypothetical protein
VLCALTEPCRSIGILGDINQAAVLDLDSMPKQRRRFIDDDMGEEWWRFIRNDMHEEWRVNRLVVKNEVRVHGTFLDRFPDVLIAEITRDGFSGALSSA